MDFFYEGWLPFQFISLGSSKKHLFKEETIFGYKDSLNIYGDTIVVFISSPNIDDRGVPRSIRLLAVTPFFKERIMSYEGSVGGEWAERLITRPPQLHLYCISSKKSRASYSFLRGSFSTLSSAPVHEYFGRIIQQPLCFPAATSGEEWRASRRKTSWRALQRVWRWLSPATLSIPSRYDECNWNDTRWEADEC